MALDSGVQGPCVCSTNIWVMGEVGTVILLTSCISRFWALIRNLELDKLN